MAQDQAGPIDIDRRRTGYRVLAIRLLARIPAKGFGRSSCRQRQIADDRTSRLTDFGKVGGEANKGRDGGQQPRRTQSRLGRELCHCAQCSTSAQPASANGANVKPISRSEAVQPGRRSPAKYPSTNDKISTIWTLPNSSCQPKIWRPKAKRPTNRAIARMFIVHLPRLVPGRARTPRRTCTIMTKER